MKSNHLKIGTVVFTFDIVCMILSLILIHQIKVHQNADVIEEKMTEILEDLAEENAVLHEKENEIILDMQKLLLKFNETEEKIREAKEWYESLEICYQIRIYIDSIAAQIDVENNRSDYIDRYFRIERDELEAIIDNYAIEEEDEFLIVTESATLLPIGDKIWLKYGTGDDSVLPIGLLVQNPMIDIGYQNVRAGMTLYEIENELPTEKEKYDLEGTSCYYFRFEDKHYQYYYISIDGSDNPTILYIELK